MGIEVGVGARWGRVDKGETPSFRLLSTRDAKRRAGTLPYASPIPRENRPTVGQKKVPGWGPRGRVSVGELRASPWMTAWLSVVPERPARGVNYPLSKNNYLLAIREGAAMPSRRRTTVLSSASALDSCWRYCCREERGL